MAPTVGSRAGRGRLACGRMQVLRAYMLTAAVLWWCATVSVSAEAPGNLSALQNVYENVLQEIENVYDKQSKAWPVAYTNTLRALQDKLQKAGDLDGWMAAKKEMERFGQDATIPMDSVVGGPDCLRTAQLDYQKAARICTLNRAQRIKDLADKYCRRLEGLKKQYTQEGRMDEAVAFSTELKRVQGSQEVTSADFVLAEEAANEPLRPPDPAPGPTNRAAASPPPRESDNEPHVYVGQPPPAPQGLTFQKVPLQRTPNMSLARMVLVDAMKATKLTNIDTDRDSGTYSSYEYSTGCSENSVRIGLKMAKATDTIENAVVVVQYFSQDIESRAGKVEPAEAAVKLVKLSKLEGKTVYVDFPPVSLHRSASSYRSAYYSSASKSGERFYGTIITVFDDKGAICFQATTSGSLVKLAVTTKPAEH